MMRYHILVLLQLNLRKLAGNIYTPTYICLYLISFPSTTSFPIHSTTWWLHVDVGGQEEPDVG